MLESIEFVPSSGVFSCVLDLRLSSSSVMAPGVIQGLGMCV